MPKIVLRPQNCIGCGSCALYAEDYFEMNGEEHAKAQLKRGKKQDKLEQMDIQSFEQDEPIQAAHGCPSNCIQVLGDNGTKLA